MALVAPLSRSRLRSRLDHLTINVLPPTYPASSSMEMLTCANCQGRTNNTSPTRRSQRRDETIPKRHYNMFDQTLLPEEDFSGGKLLRKRKTSSTSDESQSLLLNKRRRILPPPISTETQPQTTSNSKFDQIEVSVRPRPVPPETTASQTTEPTKSAAPSVPLTPQPSSQQREFRTRDKTINYTIPSLKSLLSPPLHQRKEGRALLAIPAAKTLDIPNVRSPVPELPPADTPSPRRHSKLLRTVTKRNGEKSLVLKLRIAPAKLGPLVHKQQPRIRIVESSLERKRRIEDAQEDIEEAEPKRESEKPFGGILSKEDADTSKTMPMEIDRNRFDRARAAAAVFPFFPPPNPLPFSNVSSFGLASC